MNKTIKRTITKQDKEKITKTISSYLQKHKEIVAVYVQNVIRHGQIIIDCKPNMRSDFESYILRKYFDFAPFRRRYLAEVINARL